jgi:hypothetical protein
MNISDTGGTAGNVVDGRLAENPKVSILVIEAGAGYVLTLLIMIPSQQLAD